MSFQRLSTLATLLCLLSLPTAFAQTTATPTPPHPCAAEAIKQAKALLMFHSDNDPRAEVGHDISVLPPMKNPASPKQLLDVLDIPGAIYRSDYRIRLIYARLPGVCALMGQEILEISEL